MHHAGLLASAELLVGPRNKALRPSTQPWTLETTVVKDSHTGLMPLPLCSVSPGYRRPGILGSEFGLPAGYLLNLLTDIDEVF